MSSHAKLFVLDALSASLLIFLEVSEEVSTCLTQNIVLTCVSLEFRMAPSNVLDQAINMIAEGARVLVPDDVIIQEI